MLIDSYQHKYLYAGDIFVTKRPTIVSTVLGSCVSICLWDKYSGVAGINHYVGSIKNAKNSASFKYAEPSSKHLLKRMLVLGAKRESIRAMVFGGGKVIDLIYDIGQDNIAHAKDFLLAEGIKVMNWDVGGDHGRNLQFNTHTSETHVSNIASVTHRFNEMFKPTARTKKNLGMSLKVIKPEDFPIIKPVKPILP
jgi:chemotaxis protein CheD